MRGTTVADDDVAPRIPERGVMPRSMSMLQSPARGEIDVPPPVPPRHG